jgi:Na+/H+-dicarboxylate symporter
MAIVDFFKKFQTLILIFLVVGLSVAFSPIIPLYAKQYAYTVSHVMREILMFALPFLVLPFMVSSLASLKSKGAIMVVGIMALLAFSNFSAIMAAYFMGGEFIPYVAVKHVTSLATTDELNPLISFTLTPVFGIEVALAIAFVMGLILSFWQEKNSINFFESYTKLALYFFEKIFIPILPIYICGTILKITYETDLSLLLPSIGGMVLVIFGVQVVYIGFMFLLGSGFNFGEALKAYRRALPPGFSGFSTMSSMMTMPVTLKAAEQNTQNPTLSKVTISTTVNTHIIGDSISLPLIALTIYFITFDALPSPMVYLEFALWLTLAQLSLIHI